MPLRVDVTLATALAAAVAPAAPAGAQQQALSAPAVVDSIACVRGCADAGAATGSVVRIRGRSMADVRYVVFLAGPGPADDAVGVALRARRRSVDVRVPDGAASGRVRLRNADGAPSRPSVATVTVAAMAREPERAAPAVPDRDTTDAIDAHVDRSTVFFAGGRDASLRYVVTAAGPVDVAVELVRRGGGSVARWTPGAVAPGVEQRVDWDGTVGGTPAPPGRYEFRVGPVGAVAARAAERPEVVDSFRFLDHKFPVRGRHDFGGGEAVFGTARAGHSHQGQDVFAPCGTPMVAARGGRVVFRAWHGNAGNYVVIRGQGNGVDYVYMHLEAPSSVARGERVRTGQAIGAVGATGNARGCHLHFELWSAPGWYEGGSPFDPLPSLRAWDAAS
jgi:hypothetical protein